jgi:hypothetical protein
LKYEEYPEVTEGIETLALSIGEKIKEKSMLAGLRTVSVPTTSIATIQNGELKETPLKCHDSTYYASFNELVNVDFISVRSRFLENATSEIKQYNEEFMKELKSVGLINDPLSGMQFIDWFINNLKFHKWIGSHFSKMEWSLAFRKDLLRNLKDPAKRLKLMQWMEEYQRSSIFMTALYHSRQVKVLSVDLVK